MPLHQGLRNHAVARLPRFATSDCTADKAFALFTQRLGDFNPPEHNLLAAPIAETVFDALTSGYARAPLASSIALAATALIALRTTNSRREAE